MSPLVHPVPMCAFGAPAEAALTKRGAVAKQMLADTTSGAEAQTYSSLKVVTVSATSVSTQSHADLPCKEVIVLVRRTARQMLADTTSGAEAQTYPSFKGGEPSLRRV